jgi:rod shape determining protein RodA
MGRFRYVIGSLLLIAPPAVLILLQPHLGTTILLGVIWLGMVIAAGIRLWHLLLLGLAGAASSPILWLFVLSDYHKDRLSHFLDPGGGDPLGALFNVRQALISIGSGGFSGRGYLSGTQTQLHYLRVRHTDFIFSVLAEELGFIGACVLLGIFLFLAWRALRVAALSRDAFGRYIAVGVLTYILFQTFINIGMNVRLLPVVGMPLPFVSYGGSSLITALICIGLLQSIVMRHKRLEF